MYDVAVEEKGTIRQVPVRKYFRLSAEIFNEKRT
jgi:hypothetical protein